MLNILKKITLVLLLVAGLFTGCQKDKYFVDTGVHEAKFNGTILDYLNSKPLYFDSLSRVIKLAGMEEVMSKENVTLFAPTSGCIHRSVKRLNSFLRGIGRDTISKLEQLKPTFWKQMLSMYIFNGNYRLKDFPQVDMLDLNAYPGQGYTAYPSGTEPARPMNIGVVYNNAGGVKYVGYRQLLLSFISDFSTPKSGLINNLVSTSDISTSNGIVHILQVRTNTTDGNANILTGEQPAFFGFDINYFMNSAQASGILPRE
jgi:hypothetical protein